MPFWRHHRTDDMECNRWTSCTLPYPADDSTAIELVPLRHVRTAPGSLRDSCRRQHETLCGRRKGPVWQPGSGGALPPLTGRYITSKRFEADCRLRSKVLGTGVSGQVRLAECRKTRRRFAVKSFRKGKLSAAAWKDLQNETAIYLTLDHPHIARLERVYDTGDDLHLVMECLEGGEVFDWVVKCGPYPEREAANVARQVLCAVSYLHSHNVVHRDLKLENLVYEHEDSKHLKLIDFGYATRWDGKTKMTHRCGSLQYVAPEVLARSYTEKVDLWSIGVLLYVLLTGQPLHHGSDWAIPTKIQSGKLEFVPRFFKLSKDARSFVQSLLTVNPSARPSASQALEHPWLRRHVRFAPNVDCRVLNSLRCFAKVPPLRRACLLLMASLMPSKDQASLLTQFYTLDSERKGVLTLNGLKRALGPSCEAEAEALFSCIDANSDGEVTWSEFLAVTMAEEPHLSKDVSMAAFCLFDYQPGDDVTANTISSVLGGASCGSPTERGDAMKADDGDDKEVVFGSHDEFHSFLQRSSRESQEEETPRKRTFFDKASLAPVIRGSLNVERCLPLKAGIDLMVSQWWAAFKLARMVSV